MMLSAFVAFALQALPAPGAVRWEAVTAEPTGSIWIDPTSLVREGDVARFLVRFETISAQRDGFGAIVMRMQVDCPGRRMGFDVADAYDLNGVFKETRRTPPGPTDFRPLGTSEGHVAFHRRVCGAPPN